METWQITLLRQPARLFFTLSKLRINDWNVRYCYNTGEQW